MAQPLKSAEWSLTLFTVGMQLACGFAIAATLLDVGMHLRATETMRYMGIAIFPLVAMSILVSLFHLGRPFAAGKSVLNLGRSRLSVEIVVTIIFSVSSLLYSACCLVNAARFRLELGIATVLFGLAGVLSSAAIYTVRTQPFWNSGWLPISFLGTALLFSGVAPACFRGWLPDRTSARPFLVATLFGSVAVLVSASWMLTRFCHLSRGRLLSAYRQGQRPVLSLWSTLPFGFHVLMSAILPLATAISLWSMTDNWVSHLFLRFPLPALVLILLGVVAGRALMYVAGNALLRF